MSITSDKDDNFIVRQVVAGEKELFRILVEKYKKKVNALGFGFFRNEPDCEDFAQEVFIKAYRNLEQFEAKSSFRTWLYRIAYNTGLNNIQRRREYTSLAAEDLVESPGLSPEEDSVRDAVKGAVRQALLELPEKYRICVDLFFFYGCSYDDIEKITGFPVNTVKSHVFRAKKILREKLEDLA